VLVCTLADQAFSYRCSESYAYAPFHQCTVDQTAQKRDFIVQSNGFKAIIRVNPKTRRTFS
jgi:hypothetical protein